MSDTLKDITRTIEYAANRDRTLASCDLLTLRRWASSFAALAAELAAARAEVERLTWALKAIIDVDNSHYDHHQPRPDGTKPRAEGGSCWRTPKEIARAALAPKETP